MLSLLRKYCGAKNAAVKPKNGLGLSAPQFSTAGHKEFLPR